MKKILYINNRYRHYDGIKYRTLARSFDLTVLWLGPAPADETPPQELLGLFRHEVLDPTTSSKLQPWHGLRSAKLFRRTVAHARDADLVISSTSDSWKSKIAFLAAAWCGVGIAFRKERWLDPPTPIPTRPYWAVDQFLTNFIERRSRGMLVGGCKAREYLVRRGHRDDSILQFSYLHEDLAARLPTPIVSRELSDFAGDSLTLLYLGRIMPQKGLDVLIGVMRSLVSAGEDLKLLVVGNPIAEKTGRGQLSIRYYDRCRQLAEGETRILFCGPVRADQVHDYYRAADVFVHPHVLRVGRREKHDGWGNVITEAASMSIPIVASDRVGSAFDIIEPGVSGFLVRSDHLEADLRQALTFFCRNREVLPEFGRQARRRYELTISAERTVESVQRLFDSRKPMEGAPQ